MATGRGASARPFATAVLRHRNGLGPKPPELDWAERVIALSERFHALPSAVLGEDSEMLRMLALLNPDCGKAD